MWGAVLWHVRELLGADKADPLIAETWRAVRQETGKGNAYASFANTLLQQSASVDGGKYTAQIRSIFEQRLGYLTLLLLVVHRFFSGKTEDEHLLSSANEGR